MEEKYVHDYFMIPDSKTEREERKLHHDHSFAMNEATSYLNEFRNLDYEDFIGIGRVKFMLERNVYEEKNTQTRNVLERVGARLKNLPCQDFIVKAKTETIRELWTLLMCAGVYYSSSGTNRDKNRKKFYTILKEFKSCH